MVVGAIGAGGGRVCGGTGGDGSGCHFLGCLCFDGKFGEIVKRVKPHHHPRRWPLLLLLLFYRYSLLSLSPQTSLVSLSLCCLLFKRERAPLRGMEKREACEEFGEWLYAMCVRIF